MYLPRGWEARAARAPRTSQTYADVLTRALLGHFSIDDLLDAISLATGIPSDAIICMSDQGVPLSDELLASLSQHDPAEVIVS